MECDCETVSVKVHVKHSMCERVHVIEESVHVICEGVLGGIAAFVA